MPWVVEDTTGELVGYENAAGVQIPLTGGAFGPVLGVSTWAARPAPAAVPAYTRIWFSDIGIDGGSLWWSNGTRWKPVGGVCRLLRTVTPISKSNANTSQGNLSTYTMPAGLMRTGDALELDGLFEYPNSATTKTIGCFVGATAILSQPLTTTVVARLQNRVNATSLTNLAGYAQAATPFAASANARANITVDLDTALGMSFTATWGTAGDGSLNITQLSAEFVLYTG